MRGPHIVVGSTFVVFPMCPRDPTLGAASFAMGISFIVDAFKRLTRHFEA